MESVVILASQRQKEKSTIVEMMKELHFLPLYICTTSRATPTAIGWKLCRGQ